MDYFALFLVFFVGIVIFYGIIVIHDIPYEIAVHRNHPHQDALHVAGWVSLFTLHILWPFLWIWATLYREDRGWGMNSHQNSNKEIEQLKSEIISLKSEVVDIKERLTNNKAH
jgi:hypothetical protein